MDCCFIHIWNCLMGTVSAIGMILITHYVYRMTSKANKKEFYFTMLR